MDLIKESFQSSAKKIDSTSMKRIELNHTRNRIQDNSPELDRLALNFNYSDCRHQYWNPEQFSFFWGTPLWDQSSQHQRTILNQLYWVAYYSQIISAEIATIFFNQTSAAGLYGIEDFRSVCDTLDLESAQERAHIHAFKTVNEAFEEEVFGKRIFSYPMRGPYVDTMINANTSRSKEFWRGLQLKGFAVMSSSRAFLGCQYFTVRGLRTLNGKIVQHKLSQFHSNNPQKDNSSIPSLISYHHFLDESFHFNSSLLISVEVLKMLAPPTPFESWIANRGIEGSQKDHFNFSSVMTGLFWYDPALFQKSYDILRSPVFAMNHQEAVTMLEACFTTEHEGLHQSALSRQVAMESYLDYLNKIPYLNKTNLGLSIMSKNSIQKHLEQNRKCFREFKNKINKSQLLYAN